MDDVRYFGTCNLCTSESSTDHFAGNMKLVKARRSLKLRVSFFSDVLSIL